MDKNTAVLQKAKDYAFLLLKFRQRSKVELYSRLKRKKFDESVIKQALDSLEEKRFINDEEFARAWASSRLQKNLGLRRIIEELKLKGVSGEIIASQIGRIKKDYSERDVVLALAKERLDKLKGIEPQTAKRRVYNYLLRRGFSTEIILDAINNL